MGSTLRVGVIAALAGLAAAASGLAQAPRGGYLPVHALDTTAILPPPPSGDSPAGAADRAIFTRTRALRGTPRWTLATADVAESIPSILANLSCAAGVRLTEASSPRLTALLTRLAPDVRAAVDGPKDLYRRPRPYLIDQGVICVPRTKALDASPDYPSGHATWSWTAGLILAELAPDRAAAILSRARAYGESRVVCGVHYASAVEAGRTDASALVAALHGQGAFRADLEGARAEMAGLRARAATVPDATACAAEAALTARQPW